MRSAVSHIEWRQSDESTWLESFSLVYILAVDIVNGSSELST